MAFKRSSFSSLMSTKKEYFGSAYRLSKKVKFEIGSDVYIIPLDIDKGFYETPCHKVMPHKVDGQTIGFNGFPYPCYIKCEGYDEEGNKRESLCCKLAQMEKARLPERDDSIKRIIGFTTSKIHLPVLILGNSIGDDSKISYPISKVSILNDLKSEAGLKFAYLEFSASTFMNEIILAYGKKLKEEGLIEYDLSEDSEEYVSIIQQKLAKTVIKVHGIAKQGFQAALKEYSFFPFETPAIAVGSPQGEREAIIGYRNNNDIMAKVDEFMNLFNREVDNLIPSYKEKDLQEYYNSAIGIDLKASVQEAEKVAAKTEEVVEFVEPTPATPVAPVQDTEAEQARQINKSLESEEAVNNMLDNALNQDVQEVSSTVAKATPEEELDDFEFDSDEDDFFAD